MRLNHAFLSGLLCLLLAGCGTVNTLRGVITGVGTDNTPPPAHLVKFTPQIPVRALWLVSSGSPIGTTDYLRLGPVVADNIVFTADPRGGVLATNPRNGRRFWWTSTGAPITSGPTVGEGMVVVGTNDGRIIALCESNGKILWQTNISNTILAAPAVGQGYIVAKTVDGKLIALNAQTGQIIWGYDHGAPMLIMRRGGAPQIFGNEVIAGFSDGKLAAFNLAQGHLLWEQEIACAQGVSQLQQMVDVVADPVVADGIIYAATYQGKIVAANAMNGNILWEQNISSYTGLALGPQAVFITDAQDQVWAFDRSTGAVLWHEGHLCYRVLSPPALVAGTVVIGDGGGYLHFLSQQNGCFVARRLVENGVKIMAAPATLGNLVYVVGRNGNLSAWCVGRGR